MITRSFACALPIHTSIRTPDHTHTHSLTQHDIMCHNAHTHTHINNIYIYKYNIYNDTYYACRVCNHKDYFDTRNGLIGMDYSSKLSPWLAHGCVSPRYISMECKKYENARVANKSTYWLVFELLWRDFYRFFSLKQGNRIFMRGGTIDDTSRHWAPPHVETKLFDAWCRGNTGYPLVDANMRELAATGFMSNRGRQNVASFLVFDMNVDWRLGADYFESMLVDYDVASNWGNWVAAAGLTGGRINR